MKVLGGAMALFASRDSKGRPIFLNLFQISLPVTALVSILHRISGVVMALFMPYLAWLLTRIVQTTPEAPFAFFHSLELWFLALLGCTMMYHMLAGVRHLYHDYGFDHRLQSTRFTAVAVLVLWSAWSVAFLYGLV